MTSTTWYRGAYWQVKGNREYTRSGYEVASTRFIHGDLDVELTGRHIMITGPYIMITGPHIMITGPYIMITAPYIMITGPYIMITGPYIMITGPYIMITGPYIMITGANKGLGLQTAQELATMGAVLHLVCRNMEDAREARSSIVSKTGNDKIHLYHLDLSKPRDVIKFCDEFLQSHDRLHVLINNAGVMKHERTVDDDGLEYNFAVNTMAVYLMITALVPLLQKSEDSRVITVSSGGMLSVKLDPEDLSFENLVPFDGRLAYSQTKRQQVSLTLCAAQMYDRVHFSSMHPGWVDTLAVRTSIPDFYEANKDKLRTVSQGADTIIWLAASNRALTHPSGLFFQDRVPVASHLPLAWTRSTVAEEQRFIERLQEIAVRLRGPRVPEAEPFVSEIKDEQKPKVEFSSMQKADEEIQDAKAASLPANDSKKEPNSIEECVSELRAGDAGPPNAVTSQTESQNNADVSEDSPQHLSNESVKTEERIEAGEKKLTAEPAPVSLNSSLQAAVIDESSPKQTAS
ncbi:Short-chain dehydrogenase/reductase SDR [Trinorchestia longiramus]|nr:Short-chain dehydrogenase/reductase SDR [Trinorchestia longiramus]